LEKCVLDRNGVFRGNGVYEHIAQKGSFREKDRAQTRMVKREQL